MTASLALCAALLVQQPAAVSGIVTDSTGVPLSGAVVQATGDTGRSETTTAEDGSWTIAVSSAARRVTVRIAAPGFASIERQVNLPTTALRIELQPVGITERVTVTGDTATRLAIESSVTSLDETTLALSPALMLDDQLRSVPGFSLFRRTSSRVANPTTQGVTLRGLSASGASRTLVVADDVPLNDPFGAWVYWDRVPMAALQRVDVIRGASGDLHGNDALGGVIRITTRMSPGFDVRLDGGGMGTARGSAYAATTRGRWNTGIAAESSTTDGYVVVAPESRGPIDIAADSRATSAAGWLAVAHTSIEATLRGGYFTESRGNGTPAQVNATITRWVGASAHGTAGGGAWEASGDVSHGNYRQTFSAVVGTARASERLTNLQWVTPSGGGLMLDWIRAAGKGTALISFSTRATRADLDEAAFSLAGVLGSVSRTRGRQRSAGIVLQGRLGVTPRVTLEAGARGERFSTDNLDVPSNRQARFFLEPRLGVSFHFTPDQALRVSWLSGFRTPTMNELYRSFRVGNTITMANASLGPEESWGPEVAYTMRYARWSGRAIFFATHLDGAIYNRTVSSGTLIQRVRSNGDARTIGSELELELRTWRTITITTSWVINDSTFTSGELDGKRVPQVPRVQGAVGVRANVRRFAGTIDLRVIGAQFDDDRNDFKLRAGSIADARAGWRLTKGLELFGAVENVLDEELDTGRTPIRTVGQPRTGRVGVNLRF